MFNEFDFMFNESDFMFIEFDFMFDESVSSSTKTFVAIEISAKNKKTINLFRKNQSMNKEINIFFRKKKVSLFTNLENVERFLENKKCFAEYANLEKKRLSY